MSTSIQTIAHAYHFNTRNANELAVYNELKKSLSAMGLKCFKTWGGNSHYMPKIDNLTIDLETSSLFDNQWNTSPIPGITDKGLRVFDWAQDYPAGGLSIYIKRGHWLEQNSEMRDIRANTHKCRYCGAMEPAQKGYIFCPHCLDSAYLKKSDLHLTRMKAISDKSECVELSQAEKDYLYPLYVSAQMYGATARGKARIIKARADILAECEKSISKATIKRDGLIWLMDNGLSNENVIYYDHTNKFTFGWRTKLDADTVSAILDVISEFPFPYEILCDNGIVLSGH